MPQVTKHKLLHLRHMYVQIKYIFFFLPVTSLVLNNIFVWFVCLGSTALQWLHGMILKAKLLEHQFYLVVWIIPQYIQNLDFSRFEHQRETCNHFSYQAIFLSLFIASNIFYPLPTFFFPIWFMRSTIVTARIN